MAHVEKPLQLLSFRWLKGGQVAGDFLSVAHAERT
jgi:hypothetical protein